MVNADGGDDVAFTPGVAGTVGEDDLVVALAASQYTQILPKQKSSILNGASRFYPPTSAMPTVSTVLSVRTDRRHLFLLGQLLQLVELLL